MQSTLQKIQTQIGGIAKSKVARNTDSKKKILKVVSLFSGSGGMDLGFKQEGFDLAWANDVNHWACETFKLNFGDHITEGSIVDIDNEKIPDCDIVLGGFPCQD